MSNQSKNNTNILTTKPGNESENEEKRVDLAFFNHLLMWFRKDWYVIIVLLFAIGVLLYQGATWENQCNDFWKEQFRKNCLDTNPAIFDWAHKGGDVPFDISEWTPYFNLSDINGFEDTN